VLSISQIINLFKKAPERAKALGAYAFVSVGGQSIGLLLGGALTSALSWHWIFLVNIPLGAGVCALGLAFLPDDMGRRTSSRVDIAGALTATTSLTVAIYVIINGNRAGWASAQTLLGLATATVFLTTFVGIQARVRTPLMPLRLLKIRGLLIANIVGVLSSAATFGWFFIYARYLQVLLKYDPLQVSLTYLPANLTLAVLSIGVSPALVARFGIRAPLVVGLLVAAGGLALLARTPVSAIEAVDVLPGMILLGLGIGASSTPLLLGGLNDVASSDSGVATGIIRTSSLMGAALGLSILSSVASGRTSDLLESGVGLQSALHSGYQAALYIGAVFLALAALLGTLFSSHGKAAPVAPG
jgi:hypothetical protein